MKSAQAYTEALIALSPDGTALPTDVGTNYRAVLEAIGEVLAELDRFIESSIQEWYPDSTVQQFEDWERSLGLPDPCVPEGQSLSARRDSVLTRWRERPGGINEPFYQKVAARLGYDITITRFEIGSYKWQINASNSNYRRRRFGSALYGEPYATFGNDLLECVMRRLKPSHTELIFAYGDA